MLHQAIEDTDFSDATVMFLFLPARLRAEFLPKILRSAPKAARVLTHEQAPLRSGPKPDRTLPLFASNALTVAHVWMGRGK